MVVQLLSRTQVKTVDRLPPEVPFLDTLQQRAFIDQFAEARLQDLLLLCERIRSTQRENILAKQSILLGSTPDRVNEFETLE